MVCRDFILPEFCKPCLFLSSFQFAKIIVPYPIVGQPILLLTVGFLFVGGCVGIFGRLLSRG